jgi:hypothetical protein
MADAEKSNGSFPPKLATTAFDPFLTLKASLDRKPYRFRRCAHAEPLKQMRTMHLDCLFADFQVPSDLLAQMSHEPSLQESGAAGL